ncbi:helix-turn-helix domain-containing protein [Gluconobacter albidus]
MRDVCTNAGVAVSTWTRWKRGTTSPRIDVVERIAAAALPTRAKRKEVA